MLYSFYKLYLRNDLEISRYPVIYFFVCLYVFISEEDEFAMGRQNVVNDIERVTMSCYLTYTKVKMRFNLSHSDWNL